MYNITWIFSRLLIITNNTNRIFCFSIFIFELSLHVKVHYILSFVVFNYTGKFTTVPKSTNMYVLIKYDLEFSISTNHSWSKSIQQSNYFYASLAYKESKKGVPWLIICYPTKTKPKGWEQRLFKIILKCNLNCISVCSAAASTLLNRF